MVGMGQCPALRLLDPGGGVSVHPVPSPGWTQGRRIPGKGDPWEAAGWTHGHGARPRQSRAVPPTHPAAPRTHQLHLGVGGVCLWVLPPPRGHHGRGCHPTGVCWWQRWDTVNVRGVGGPQICVLSGERTHNPPAWGQPLPSASLGVAVGGLIHPPLAPPSWKAQPGCGGTAGAGGGVSPPNPLSAGKGCPFGATPARPWGGGSPKGVCGGWQAVNRVGGGECPPLPAAMHAAARGLYPAAPINARLPEATPPPPPWHFLTSRTPPQDPHPGLRGRQRLGPGMGGLLVRGGGDTDPQCPKCPPTPCACLRVLAPPHGHRHILSHMHPPRAPTHPYSPLPRYPPPQHPHPEHPHPFPLHCNEFLRAQPTVATGHGSSRHGGGGGGLVGALPPRQRLRHGVPPLPSTHVVPCLSFPQEEPWGCTAPRAAGGAAGAGVPCVPGRGEDGRGVSMLCPPRAEGGRGGVQWGRGDASALSRMPAPGELAVTAAISQPAREAKPPTSPPPRVTATEETGRSPRSLAGHLGR